MAAALCFRCDKTARLLRDSREATTAINSSAGLASGTKGRSGDLGVRAEGRGRRPPLYRDRVRPGEEGKAEKEADRWARCVGEGERERTLGRGRAEARGGRRARRVRKAGPG